MNSIRRSIHVALLLSLAVPFLGVSLFGADDPTYHYVRAGASPGGNGSTWTAAWQALPATLVRGHTYYIGDGSYSGYVFNTAESGSTYIYVKKATVADHGTSTGWQDSFGSAYADFSLNPTGHQLWFTTGYWVLDGQVGGGPGSWTAGHGFRISGALDSQKLIRLGDYRTTQQPNYITIKHVELKHRGLTNKPDDIIYSWAAKGMGCQHITISHCYIHESGRDLTLLMYTRYAIVEYNYYHRNNSSPEQHATCFEDFGSCNMTFRYNMVGDISGTAYIDMKKNWDDPHLDWDIYGNIFFCTPGNPFGVTGVGNGIIASTSPTGPNGVTNNIKIYNNTFANLIGLKAGLYFPVGTGNEGYNNLYYNCAQVMNENITCGSNSYHNTPMAWQTTLSANDISATTVPFRNPDDTSFDLAGPTQPGRSDLPAPISIDMLGHARGEHDAWDRGALEFVSPPDTQNPTVPPSLAGSANSATQITVSWSASTDNIGVKGYKVFRNDALLTTCTATQYENTGLSPATAYTYKVQAYDYSGNLSGFSNTAPVTTPASGFSVNDVSVADPLSGSVNAVFLVTLSTVPAQPVTVRVSTADITASASGGDYQSLNLVLTFTPPTTQIAVPVRVNAGATQTADETFALALSEPSGAPLERAQGVCTIGSTARQLTDGLMGHWKLDEGTGTTTADASGRGNTGTLVNSPAWEAGHLDNALRFNGTNSYFTGTNNFSLTSALTIALWVNPVGATAADQKILSRSPYVRPFSMSLIKITNKAQIGVRTTSGITYLAANAALPLNEWSHVAATYTNGVLTIYVNGQPSGTAAPTGNLNEETAGSTTAIGCDGSGGFFNGAVDDVRIYNRTLSAENIASLYSSSGTAPGDTTAPSVPSALAATPLSSTEIRLTWGASTDAVGVAGYKVFRDGALVSFSSAGSYTNSGLAPSTSYSYTVSAYDMAGNESAQASPASATTPAGAGGEDTQAPTAPGSLSATTPAARQIQLAWAASTDNTGVTGYNVYRSGASGGGYAKVNVSPVAGLGFTDTGLADATEYYYVVKAVDAAANESVASPEASATTSAAADTQAPTVPGGLSATATVAKQIQLAWAASTDNVAVTGYNVYRSSASGGGYAKVNGSPVAGLGFTDTGLEDATKYYYVVKAVDAAANESAASAEASATTIDTTAPGAPKNVVAQPLS